MDPMLPSSARLAAHTWPSGGSSEARDAGLQRLEPALGELVERGLDHLDAELVRLQIPQVTTRRRGRQGRRLRRLRRRRRGCGRGCGCGRLLRHVASCPARGIGLLDEALALDLHT
eukprot:scaffold31288_cov36-Phaeocystis_antarctica.AAC.4